MAADVKCPTCGAKLREERTPEVYKEKVCAAERAPEITYQAVWAQLVCPRCGPVSPRCSHQEEARRAAVRSWWMQKAFACGYSYPDVQRSRELIEKVSEESGLETKWLVEWLTGG